LNDEPIPAEIWSTYNDFLDYLEQNMNDAIKLMTKYKTFRGNYASTLYKQALQYANEKAKNKLVILLDYFDLDQIAFHSDFKDLTKSLKTDAAKEIFNSMFIISITLLTFN